MCEICYFILLLWSLQEFAAINPADMLILRSNLLDAAWIVVFSKWLQQFLTPSLTEIGEYIVSSAKI